LDFKSSEINANYIKINKQSTDMLVKDSKQLMSLASFKKPSMLGTEALSNSGIGTKNRPG
jgi:hypothetical protein